MQLPTQRKAAQQFAQLAEKRHRELIEPTYTEPTSMEVTNFYQHPIGMLMTELFRKEWDACRCIAAIYEGTELRNAGHELDEIIAQFEEILRQDRQQNGLLSTRLPEFKRRLLNIVAEGLEFAGFAYANLYDFKAAEKRYRRADDILDRTGFKTLHAEVKNDLSRVLGELGALHQALTLCEAGLTVRNQYGFDYLSGLSNNTLSLINVRNGRPTRARYYAENALGIFRRLENLRGIGLALIQVAEARRRIWGLTANEAHTDPFRQSKVDPELLDEVVPLLDEAEKIFSERFDRDARLVEVWIEKGCLYRDWAAFFGLDQARTEFEKSRQQFQQAMGLAKDQNYPQHYLSACTNLAWLYGHCKLLKEADNMAQHALGSIESNYILNDQHPLDVEKTTNVVNFRELSKISSLRALVLLPKTQDDAALLREYIFAITYLQLFSSYAPFYLEVTKRDLAGFIDRYKSKSEKNLQELMEQIIADYHLRPLTKSIGHLQAEIVITTALKSGGTLDYLD